jgi:hypothetical protein
VAEVVGRIGYVMVMVADDMRCYYMTEVVEGYDCVVEVDWASALAFAPVGEGC